MRSYPTPVRYTPINKHKYVGDIEKITMRSSWESKLAHFLDLNDNIIKWGSETKPISYYSSVDGRVRRYFPDFFVILIDKDKKEKKLIIEVKPSTQTKPPKTYNRKRKTIINEQVDWIRNQEKWKAATEYAAKIGWEFVVLTEKELRY